MIRREIEVDENTDRILTELASDYGGDLGKALQDLVLARERMEEVADRSEGADPSNVRALRDRAEAVFREGRKVSWDDVKARSRV